jgi:phosphoribosylamine---glycine ligase
MRFLGIGNSNDLAAMYYGLAQRGHEVRVFVRDPDYAEVFTGLLQFTPSWEQELGWVRAAGPEGFVLFESASDGATQDALRREGFQVIGGSALGDRLEADREFGQSALRSVGLRTAKSFNFSSYQAAIDFLNAHPARYVLKMSGADAVRTRSLVGSLASGADIGALLTHYLHTQAPPARTPTPTPTPVQHPPEADDSCVLMEYIDGIEVGVGAYFNGEQFLSPACIDFEHKRFFPGDLGELTGEMGTIVSYRHSSKLFNTVLAPVGNQLRESGYCGYINVNLIANADGLWPLEFTSRFGYPGFAICEALHTEPWEAIFTAMACRNRLSFGTRDGFAAGVVLTVPPFPHRYGYAHLSKGLPIFVDSSLSEADRQSIHFAEVAKRGEQLVTSGTSGYVGVSTGWDSTPQEANAHALRRARGVAVPNLRYRTDIGQALADGHWAQLSSWGWLQ